MADAPPVIAAATSLLEAAMRDLYGDRVQVLAIAPPGSCPGHYDLKPQDLRALLAARAVILHDFQRGMGDKLTRAGFPARRLLIVPEQGSLITPPGYRSVLELLAREIPERVPELKEHTGPGLAAALKRLEKSRDKAEALAGDRLRGRPVVVSEFQAEFVRYFGMAPVAEIKGVGEISTRELADIGEAARAKKALAVVGNEQSGRQRFEAVSQMLSLPLIMLSNFPASGSGHEAYDQLLTANVRALCDGTPEP
jgi:zinc transport system substrate-binding protein